MKLKNETFMHFILSYFTNPEDYKKLEQLNNPNFNPRDAQPFADDNASNSSNEDAQSQKSNAAILTPSLNGNAQSRNNNNTTSSAVAAKQQEPKEDTLENIIISMEKALANYEKPAPSSVGRKAKFLYHTFVLNELIRLKDKISEYLVKDDVALSVKSKISDAVNAINKMKVISNSKGFDTASNMLLFTSAIIVLYNQSSSSEEKSKW